MYVIVVLVSLASFSVLGALPSGEELQNRIVGGNAVDITHYKYQALVIRRVINSTMNKLCGGSIISKRFVLTAAHCAYKVDPRLFTIYVGSAYSYRGLQLRLSNVHINKKYEPKSPLYSSLRDNTNDIAILELAQELVYRNTIGPITLAPKGMLPAPGREAEVSGWGNIDKYNSTNQSRVLLATKLRIYENIIEGEEIAVIRAIGAGKNGFCAGDSGGPLVVDGVLYGVVSGVANFECVSGSPDYFASIGYNRDFINRVTQL